MCVIFCYIVGFEVAVAVRVHFQCGKLRQHVPRNIIFATNQISNKFCFYVYNTVSFEFTLHLLWSNLTQILYGTVINMYWAHSNMKAPIFFHGVYWWVPFEFQKRAALTGSDHKMFSLCDSHQRSEWADYLRL